MLLHLDRRDLIPPGMHLGSYELVHRDLREEGFIPSLRTRIGGLAGRWRLCF